MEIPAAEVVLSSRMGLDKQNQDRFWSWLDPEDDDELAEVFYTAIQSAYVIKQVAVVFRS